MVSQLLDCFALLFATFALRNPAAYFTWKPSSEDVDRIAKPTATMIARRPQLQNTVKRFAAPGMLGGGITAYVMPRLFGLRSPQAPARTPQQQAPATGEHAAPSPAAGAAGASGESAQLEQRERLAPEQAQRLASAIGGLVDNIRSGIPS